MQIVCFVKSLRFSLSRCFIHCTYVITSFDFKIGKTFSYFPTKRWIYQRKSIMIDNGEQKRKEEDESIHVTLLKQTKLATQFICRTQIDFSCQTNKEPCFSTWENNWPFPFFFFPSQQLLHQCHYLNSFSVFILFSRCCKNK